MRLYNVHERSAQYFEPRQQPATVYVCGITPYDTTHLGHAFTYVMFDVLIRYLEFTGSAVRYVQNVTDIDDDILRKARQVDDDWQALGDRWTAHFIRDMQALNVRPPDHYTRATDFIPGIVEAVQKLIEAGVAYESGGSVYFRRRCLASLWRAKRAGAPRDAAHRQRARQQPRRSAQTRSARFRALAGASRRVSRPGPARGVKGAPDGTSNARPWQPACWATPSISTAVAPIWSFLITKARLPRPKRPPGSSLSCVSGCTRPWCATRAKR